MQIHVDVNEYSVPDLTNTLVTERTIPHSHVPKPRGKPSQKNEGYYNSKGGLNLEWDGVFNKHIC